MATVGIVGGLGPESTIDYYRRILEVWARDDPTTAPSIVIDSLDVRRALYLVERDRSALTEYLLASLRRLAGAGVDFAAMSANTPHIVFDDLAARAPVPLISMVEVCAHEARQRGLRRLGLLGTRFTMEGPFYPAVCARYGIAVVTPNDVDGPGCTSGMSASCSTGSSGKAHASSSYPSWAFARFGSHRRRRSRRHRVAVARVGAGRCPHSSPRHHGAACGRYRHAPTGGCSVVVRKPSPVTL